MAWVALANYPLADSPTWYCADPAVGGKVYAGGGLGGSATYVYDPATDAWTAKASHSVARSPHAASIYIAGKVYVFGGGTTAAEVYDVASNTWTTLTPMPDQFSSPGDGAGFIVRYGGVIIMGTITTGGFGATLDHLKFNIATGAWTRISGASVNTDGFTKNGTVLGDYAYMLRSGDVARLDLNTTGLIYPTITGGLGTPDLAAYYHTSLATFGTVLVLWGGAAGDVWTLDPNTGGEPYAPSAWTDLGSGTAHPVGNAETTHSQPWNGDNIFLIGRKVGVNFFYKLGVDSIGALASSARDTIGDFRFHPRWPELARRAAE